MRINRYAAVALILSAVGLPVYGQQAPPAGAAPQPAARPAPLKSPEIHPDRTVTFRLLAPKATEVTLNGSWDNGTDLKMTKDECRRLVGDHRPARAAALGLLVRGRRRQGARSRTTARRSATARATTTC